MLSGGVLSTGFIPDTDEVYGTLFRDEYEAVETHGVELEGP